MCELLRDLTVEEKLEALDTVLDNWGNAIPDDRVFRPVLNCLLNSFRFGDVPRNFQEKVAEVYPEGFRMLFGMRLGEDFLEHLEHEDIEHEDIFLEYGNIEEAYGKLDRIHRHLKGAVCHADHLISAEACKECLRQLKERSDENEIKKFENFILCMYRTQKFLRNNGEIKDLELRLFDGDYGHR